MEGLSHFDVIGNVPEEEKEKAKKESEGFLYEDHLGSIDKANLEKLRINEYPKNEEEKFLIDFINKETNKIMEDLGIKSFDVPERNFHIVPHELFEEIAGDNSSGGITDHKHQIIGLDANDVRSHPIVFAAISFHEILHLKTKHIIQISKPKNEAETDVRKKFYKIGLTTGSSLTKDEEGEEHVHFKGLHEAVVANEEKKFISKLVDLDMFFDLKEWINSGEAMGEKMQIWHEKKIPIDEIFYIDLAQKHYFNIGYSNQREVLLYVCDEIAKDIGVSEEDIQKEFLKANFSGKLLGLAKMVEKTFGKGSFRELGNLDVDKSSAHNVLEALKKFRLRKQREASAKLSV